MGLVTVAKVVRGHHHGLPPLELVLVVVTDGMKRRLPAERRLEPHVPQGVLRGDAVCRGPRETPLHEVEEDGIGAVVEHLPQVLRSR